MAKTTSKSRQAYYSLYKASNRWKTNRERKLLRALKRNPNNKQIEQALNNISYRRKTPGKVGGWSSTRIMEAQLMRLATNPGPSKPKTPVTKTRFGMFSLAARAHNGRGSLLWM